MESGIFFRVGCAARTSRLRAFEVQHTAMGPTQQDLGQHLFAGEWIPAGDGDPFSLGGEKRSPPVDVEAAGLGRLPRGLSAVAGWSRSIRWVGTLAFNRKLTHK